MSLTISLCVLGWLLGWAALGRARQVGTLQGGGGAASNCTIVIPARNEESSLAGLLSDLERDPGLADALVVVVDDHSTDRTAEVAREFGRAHVVPAPTLPHGWTGKSWACHVGADAAGQHGRGPLVFLDADVRCRPGSIEALVVEQQRVGGLLSVQPRHWTERWYEQLSGLFNIIAVMGVGHGHRSKGAFGPVLVTTFDEYERIGGHASVRDEIVEDLALARRYREEKLPVSVLLGGDDIRFRMYPDGPAQLVEGWTKNFALGAGSTPGIRLAAIVVWITAMVASAVALSDAVRGEFPVLWGVALYGAFVVQLQLMLRLVGRFRALTAVVFPILLVCFMAVFVRSLWRTYVRRSVTWRGRTISTARQRG